MRPWLALGALGCAVGVVAGAFGAHGLASRLDARALSLWETAVRYWFIASFGLLALGLAVGRPLSLDMGGPGFVRGTGLCLALGALVFSGTVAALALGGPRWLGAVTPIGGLLLIVGFALFAWAAWRMGDG